MAADVRLVREESFNCEEVRGKTLGKLRVERVRTLHPLKVESVKSLLKMHSMVKGKHVHFF